MKIEIINQDNQYIEATVQSVLSLNAAGFLRKQLESPDCTVKEEIRYVLDKASQLSVFESFRTLSSLDTKILHNSGINTISTGNSEIYKLNVYGFVTLGRPNAKRPTTPSVNIIEKKDESWGLGIAGILNDKKFQLSYQKTNEIYHFEEKRDISLAELVKKNKAMLIKSTQLKELDEMATLTGKSDKSAVVLYSPSSNGFLNYDGKYSSLLSARIFQSLKVAENTARARGLNHHIFVNVELDIKGLSIAEQQSEEIGVLRELISKKEKEELCQQFTTEPKEVLIANALKAQFPEIYEKLLLDIEQNTQHQVKPKNSRI